jgi:hypothetical protein
VNASTSGPISHRRGRPPSAPLQVCMRVIDLRSQGLSLSKISKILNLEGVPTPAGRSTWTKTHVDRLLHTRHVQELLKTVLVLMYSRSSL